MCHLVTQTCFTVHQNRGCFSNSAPFCWLIPISEIQKSIDLCFEFIQDWRIPKIHISGLMYTLGIFWVGIFFISMLKNGVSLRVATLLWRRSLRVHKILRRLPPDHTLWRYAPGRVVHGRQKVKGEFPDKPWPEKKTSTVKQAENSGWPVNGASFLLRMQKKSAVGTDTQPAVEPGPCSVKDCVVTVHAPVSTSTWSDIPSLWLQYRCLQLSQAPQKGPARWRIILDLNWSLGSRLNPLVPGSLAKGNILSLSTLYLLDVSMFMRVGMGRTMQQSGLDLQVTGHAPLHFKKLFNVSETLRSYWKDMLKFNHRYCYILIVIEIPNCYCNK